MDIYTIGHSSAPLSVFLSLLEKHRILSVVDVRSKPFSRYAPYYNRGAIEHYLRTAGIGYYFFSDKDIGNLLGGFPGDPECYENGVVSYETVRTRRWFLDALTELMSYAKDRRVALMCSEENPYQCHRHTLLTQELLTRGVFVWHIRGDGSLERAGKDFKQVSLASFF